MTAVVEDLAQWAGRKITVTVNRADEHGNPTAVEIEGSVETASPVGLLIKPKGKSGIEMILADEIEPGSIVSVVEKPKALKAKSVKAITFGNVRAHLLASHGATLTEVNDLTEESAVTLHDGIDHSDLGHKHDLVDKPTAEAAATS